MNSIEVKNSSVYTYFPLPFSNNEVDVLFDNLVVEICPQSTALAVKCSVAHERDTNVCKSFLE